MHPQVSIGYYTLLAYLCDLCIARTFLCDTIGLLLSCTCGRLSDHPRTLCVYILISDQHLIKSSIDYRA